MITFEKQNEYLANREKLKYMVFDLETQNHKYKGRVASPFCKDNWVVMAGWKVQGDTRAHSWYEPTNVRKPLFIPDDVNMLVGHNLKFDLLWMWETEELRNFIKRGGRIWDTQTAEYLLRGMTEDFHMNSMDQIAESYGGRLKLDEVARLWKEEGALTADIDPKLLKDYLIGTEEENFDSGDIGNTEKIFKGQWNLALKQKQIPMIEERMNAYLAITEAEYNGLFIDQELGNTLLEENKALLSEFKNQLDSNLGELPDGCVFNWGSSNDVSCFLFGGTKPFKVREPIVDELNFPTFAKGKREMPVIGDDGEVVRFKGGKNKGEIKTKKVDVPDLRKPKLKYFDKGFKFGRKLTPLREWQGKKVTQWDEPIYSVGKDTMDYLKETRTEPYIKDYLKYTGMSKDITTYFKVTTRVRSIDKPIVDKEGVAHHHYISKDPGTITMDIPEGYVADQESGMLTLIGDDGRIHHTINANSTVTGRYSSKAPNMQNIPKGNKSKVKQLFISRFKDGYMSEIDYSQLEVVVLGALSKDPQLVKDLINRIDFHCKRVAMKYRDEYPGGYDEVVGIRKDEKDYGHKMKLIALLEKEPDTEFTEEDKEAMEYAQKYDKATYELLDLRRTACKILSFQKQYGAGAKTIAETVGLPVAEVEEMLRLEDEMYPGVVRFNEMIEKHVNKFKRSVWSSKFKSKYVRASWQCDTGTIYTWTADLAPSFMQKQGITHSFNPPQLKNYPIQGTGGEMVQSSIGRMFRAMVKEGYWSGGDNSALFVNTVHDCVWFDFKNKQVADKLIPIIIQHLENIPAVYKMLFDMDIEVPFPVEAEIGTSMYDLGHWEPDKEK